MTSRRIPTTLIAVAMAGAVPGAAHAVRIDYTIDAGYEHDDNVTLSAEDQIEQDIARVGFGFALEQASSTVQASMIGRIDHRRYEDVYDNLTDRMFEGRLNWMVVPDRLALVLEDSYGVQTINRTAPGSPDNRQQVNVLSVGPDLQFGLGPARRGVAELRYINSDAEVTQEFNSDRVLAGLRILQELDATRTLSWNMQGQQVDFDNDEFARDHRRYEAFVGYRHVFRRFDMTVDAGYAYLDYEDGQTRGDPLLRAAFGWEPTERSRFSVALANQFSDAAVNALDQIDTTSGVPASVLTGNTTITAYAYEQRSIGVDYTYTGTRLTVSFNGTAQELDYVDEAASGEESRGAGASLRYRLRPTLVLSGSAYTNRSEFGAPEGRTETDRLYAIGLEKEWSRHWSTNLSVTRYERESSAAVGDFEQNVVYLNLTYRNR
ncbi:outer membrane beta-barrel protein [Luteimonas kalidii]|uniref:Outer membrane beta-barrel protein n=1 Tax=Luteimonas kalidii TaxID=3042025 RepID=A0ABT6JTH9_9GAMM|nr:outer membrane beta-barrel protein [Luteimonas kalidii]MDH5833912.1 outer membrane beta-barrel protein [Luteimonas kalidii]